MIETLILGTLAIVASAIIGYSCGKIKSDSLHYKYNGWEFTAFKGNITDRFYFDIQNDQQRITLVFDCDTGKVNIDITKGIDE